MFIESANAAAANDTIAVQGAVNLPPVPDTIQSSWMGMVPMVLIFVVFYFLLIRPQEKKRKEQVNTLKSLKKGEKVVTSGGILGVVVSIDENENVVELEVAKDLNIKFLKNAITDILSRTTEADKSSKKEVNISSRKIVNEKKSAKS